MNTHSNADALAASSSRPNPALVPSPDEPAVQRWEALFAEEPELVLAVLEEDDSATARQTAGLVLQAARRAANRMPRYADLHYFAAHAACRARQWPEAARLLERAIDLNPRYNDALILAARVARTQGDFPLAIQHLRAALDNGADYPDVHLLLGDVWRETGAPQLAQQAYQRALQLNANLAAARAGLLALTRAAKNQDTGGSV